MNARYPAPTYSHLFGRRAHTLRDHHRPGSVRFTWNARGALFQLLEALPRDKGATILVPAYHCMALVKPIVAAGFEIACYRVRTDLTIDLDDLAAQLRADVVAVVVIHFFGFPADLDGVLPLVRTHGALLIEDCSHSFLTRDRDRPLGQRGDFAVFSYYKCAPSVVGGGLVANGAAPLPQARDADAPWPARLTVLRRWLKGADDRAPKRSMRVVQRVLGRLARRALTPRAGPAATGMPGAERALPPPGFLDDPYFFDVALARAGLPWYLRRAIEASPWEAIALARRRNYAALCASIPDSAVLHRPLPHLADGIVPYMFPLLFRDRRQHEVALREAGIPFLRFGEVLDGAVERAGEAARRDAEDLSGSLLLLPCHQDLDSQRIAAFVNRLLDYVKRRGHGSGASADPA